MYNSRPVINYDKIVWIGDDGIFLNPKVRRYAPALMHYYKRYDTVRFDRLSISSNSESFPIRIGCSWCKYKLSRIEY